MLTNLSAMVITAISFIAVFSVIVFIHEFGHFMAARLNGIFVKEFSIGMGPAFLKWQGKETLYSLKAFPIGGSVQMEGEDEASDDPNSFGKKAAWQRFMVIVAGPLMNFVLALVILFFLSLSMGYQTTKIAEFIPGMPAATSGLEKGDQIIFVNLMPIDAWSDLTEAIDQSGSEPLRIQILRDNQVLAFNVPVVYDELEKRNLIGIRPMIEKSIPMAIKASADTTYYWSKMIVMFIPKLFTDEEARSQVSGPVGIAKVVGEAAGLGIRPLLTFTAFISVNLGIMNLLPIPALDGGRIIFISYEMILRRKPNQMFEQRLHYIGFVLLLTLMAVVVVSDVLKLFKG